MATPGEATHKFCTDCVGGSAYDIRNCGGDKCRDGGCDKHGVCWFYPYRLGEGRPKLKLIRMTCLWCMGDSSDFVRDCRSESCALHSFRLGKNPNIGENQRAALRLAAQKRGLKGGVSLREAAKFQRTAVNA